MMPFTSELPSELAFLAAPTFLPLIIILIGFDMIMKAIALWKSGRNNQLGWFVCLFIFNTVGILPIVYILFFQKKQS